MRSWWGFLNRRFNRGDYEGTSRLLHNSNLYWTWHVCPIELFSTQSCTSSLRLVLHKLAFGTKTQRIRGGGGGGRLFEAGRLIAFSAFRMGAYSRLGAYSNKYGTRYSQYNKTYLITLLVFACFVVIFPIYSDLSDSPQPLACEPQTYFRSSLEFSPSEK